MSEDVKPHEENETGATADGTIVYEAEVMGESMRVELPFVVGVLGDFSNRAENGDAPESDGRRFVELSTESFETVLSLATSEASRLTPRRQATIDGLRRLMAAAQTDPFVRVRVLDIAKSELAETFRTASQIDQSELFRLMVESEYGQFAGQPFGVVLLDFEFTHDAADIGLLESLATIGSHAMCTFVAPAAPGLFGVETWRELSANEDIESIFASAAYLDWRALRELEVARHLVLTVPNAAAEQGRPTQNPVYELGSELVRVYAQTRGWNLAGAGATSADAAPLFSSEQRAALARCGFLTVGDDAQGGDTSDTLVTFQRPRKYHDPEATEFAAVSAHLPYVLTATQFGRAIKCMIRDQVGSFRSDEETEQYLRQWIERYVVDAGRDAEGDPSDTRVSRPLDDAKIEVANFAGLLRGSGTSTAVLDVRPNLGAGEMRRYTRYSLAIPSHDPGQW